MGTPEPAVHVLKELISEHHEVVMVVTQPDRPKGRGQEMQPPPVKVVALQHKIPVIQPEKLKDAALVAQLKTLQPDLIVIVAYGKILPREIIDIPRLACLNLHAALLPKYRGAAPIQWAILNGEKETGMTIFQLVEALDAGPIYAQEKLPIKDYDNANTMLDKLFRDGARLLVKLLVQMEKGKITPVNQDEKLVTFAPKISKEMGEIDWKKSAQKIHDQVRALVSWPGAHTYYKGKTLKIFDTRLIKNEAEGKPGEVIKIDKEGIIIACGDGALLLKEVQLEGKARHAAFDFANGAKLKNGMVFPN
jgi:methionyl-tRNA formyltransferase